MYRFIVSNTDRLKSKARKIPSTIGQSMAANTVASLFHIMYFFQAYWYYYNKQLFICQISSYLNWNSRERKWTTIKYREKKSKTTTTTSIIIFIWKIVYAHRNKQKKKNWNADYAWRIDWIAQKAVTFEAGNIMKKRSRQNEKKKDRAHKHKHTTCWLEIYYKDLRNWV